MTVYPDLSILDKPGDLPTAVINMVSTIDGKILSGNRDEHVMDLGSKIDHETMRSIENACDAVMIGAGSLRATPGLWYDKNLIRIVVSGSAELDYDARFFTDSPEKVFVVTSHSGIDKVPWNIRSMVISPDAGFRSIFARLKSEQKIERLLVEGGSELNASILQEDLVDEVFLTIAPKIKLGRDVPTIADGDSLDRLDLLLWNLVSHVVVDDEIFLRYRRAR